MYLSETDGRIHADFALKRTFPEMPENLREAKFHLFILQSSGPRYVNQDRALRWITATSQQTQSSLNMPKIQVHSAFFLDFPR